jgi:predicted dehydrogenase
MNAAEAAQMRDAADRNKRVAMIAHEFRFAPQRRYIKRLLHDGYIGRFNLCTIELFLDRYVSAQPRPLTWQAYKAEGGGLLGALGSHYIDGLRDWFGEIAAVHCKLSALRPDVLDAKSGKVVKAETDDTFTFTIDFVGGGTATMVASFATTPARGARLVVMGDEGTLVAEQSGPNPTDDGVVIASRKGSPLAPLPTPADLAVDTDPRDHRLMSFRALVREFTRGIEEGVSPHPSFEDGWRCQQVLDAARQSSESGRTVAIG